MEKGVSEEKGGESVLSPKQKLFDEEEGPGECHISNVGNKEMDSTQSESAHRQLLALEELTESERKYLRLLQLCTSTIRGNLLKLQPPPENLDSIFLYIDDVMDVSRRLLSLLDQKQPGDSSYLEALCNSFLSLSSDMEAAYKEYMANYNNVIAFENNYKQKEDLWNNMVTVIKTSAPEVNATSLSFFLVMPVQRMARYPLLLQSIQKHTKQGSPDYELLEQTTHTSISLNCHINEYKRFREVADKYKKTENLSIKDKINRLNSHSIVKKTARLSQQLKHETGIAPKLVDEDFNALEVVFYTLEHGILELLKNVETYLHHLQLFLSCKIEQFDFDMDGEKTPICYKEITTALRQWVLPAFESRIQKLIYKPLCILRDLLVGPRNLIRKRLDKLLDYELIESKASLCYEEQSVANTYRTINKLLLTELPRFNGLALQTIWSLLGTFSCLHRDLASEMEQLFHSFAQQLPHSSLSHCAFWDWAGSEVLQGAQRLQVLCQQLEDSLNASVFQPLSPASQRRLKQLINKHGFGKIYQLSTSVVGSRDLDLSLSRGELVAVISEADSQGDKRRWLVDTGGRRGYAPASKLVRYHQVTEEPHRLVPESQIGLRRHSYTPESQPLSVCSVPCFQVFAAYDFTARGNREVSMLSGEPVQVIEQHDKKFNYEWSLVEVRGHRGYVPSNYLCVKAVGAGAVSTSLPRDANNWK